MQTAPPPFWFELEDEPPPPPAEPVPAPVLEVQEPELDESWREAWHVELEAARQKRAPRKRRRVGALATGTAIAAAAAVVTVAAVLTHITPQTTQAANAAFRTHHHRTVSYMRLYRRVAREYGLEWTVLAAVGQIESRNGRSQLPGIHSGTNAYGAAGPAQFMTTTWARFGVDPHAKGHPNPYDPLDAITAMAAYLKASGAPEDWARALYTYNHSRAYVDEVLKLTRKLAAQTA